ncbi:MAG: S8 family serine peptidase [Gemmataceae bacterium]
MKRLRHVSAPPVFVLALQAALLLAALARPEGKADSLLAKQQPLFERLNVAGAWKVTKGDPKVLVGVIDNGFDFFHPDLKGQLIPGLYYPGGYHTEFYENVAHGTLVSSLIVARDDNPGGMVGLAPRCRVLTASQGMIEHTLVKMQRAVFQKDPKATLADLQQEMMKHPDTLKKFGQDWVHYQVDGAANAIRYLVDHGVKVVNISGALKRSLCPSAERWKKLEEAFSYAEKRGVVIVLSAGQITPPSGKITRRLEAVLVVGATPPGTTPAGRRRRPLGGGRKIKQGSNYGKRLSVVASVERLVVRALPRGAVHSCKDGPMGAMKLPFKGAYDVRANGGDVLECTPIVSVTVRSTVFGLTSTYGPR